MIERIKSFLQARSQTARLSIFSAGFCLSKEYGTRYGLLMAVLLCSGTDQDEAEIAAYNLINNKADAVVNEVFSCFKDIAVREQMMQTTDFLRNPEAASEFVTAIFG